MKHCLDVLMNIRIIAGELGATLTLIFLVVYGAYRAWLDFGAEVFKQSRRRSFNRPSGSQPSR